MPQPPSPYPQQPPTPVPYQQPQPPSPYPQQQPTPVPYQQQPPSPYPQQQPTPPPYQQQPPSPYPQQQPTPPPYPQVQGTPTFVPPPTDQQTYQASPPASSGGLPKSVIAIGAALVVAIGGGMWLARSGDDNSISTVSPTTSPSPGFTPNVSSPDPIDTQTTPLTTPEPGPTGAGPSQDNDDNVIATDNYGAIARSPISGDKGFSWNYSDRDGAEERAINECNSLSGSTDCEILVWFRNACGAIAESDDGGAGTGWGANEELANQYAIESCNSIGTGCEVTRTICTD
jgi:hypothetical protein